jgi:hypothetical protein
MDYIIYKITNLDDGKCYIGSTTLSLKQRIGLHKSNSKAERKCSCHYFNWENIAEEVVDVPCVVIDDRYIREQYCKDNSPNCVNKYNPYKTEEEAREQKAEYNKQHHQDNKEQHKQTNKNWYSINKEEHNKKQLEKTTCECGCILSKSAMYRHKKSNKHINFINK